jgi:hypothetical protein
MLRQVCTVIERHRQRGQTTRLVSICDDGDTLLITANKQAERHIADLAGARRGVGRAHVTTVSLHGLNRERGREHKNGVAFDNFAVHMIAGMADREILTLQDRVAYVERQNAHLQKQLEYMRENDQRTTAVMVAQAQLLNDVLPPTEPRDTGGNPPWGESYEAVQDLSEAVRRAVALLGGRGEE